MEHSETTINSISYELRALVRHLLNCDFLLLRHTHFCAGCCSVAPPAAGRFLEVTVCLPEHLLRRVLRRRGASTNNDPYLAH